MRNAIILISKIFPKSLSLLRGPYKLGGMKTISVQALRDFMVQGTPYYLLDIREQHEYDAGHIDGCVHIPMGMLREQYQTLPHNKPLIVYCKIGGRSADVTRWLNAHGYPNAMSLDGGIIEWLAHEK